jgi:tRNA pseudouridine55 synthase
MPRASGLLLVDKAAGWTSHDVVARLRGVLGERRVGHAGTLDPMATGLLVVAVGPSTRLLRFAQAGAKSYDGEVLFGVETDSLDADGEVTASAPVPALDEASVAVAAAGLLGAQMQVPPMVSAVKVAGRRLHEIARAGGTVARSARPVEVTRFDVRATGDPARWSFSVECSTGTYVRVLASELAHRLSTVGHLVALRRTRSGAHDVRDARTIEEIARMAAEGALALGAPLGLVGEMARVTVSEDQARAVRHGQLIESATTADLVAALDEAGQLVGVLGRSGERYRPVVVLAVADDGRR